MFRLQLLHPFFINYRLVFVSTQSITRNFPPLESLHQSNHIAWLLLPCDSLSGSHGQRVSTESWVIFQMCLSAQIWVDPYLILQLLGETAYTAAVIFFVFVVLKRKMISMSTVIKILYVAVIPAYALHQHHQWTGTANLWCSSLAWWTSLIPIKIPAKPAFVKLLAFVECCTV